MDYDKIEKAIDELDQTSKELKSFSNLFSDLSNLHRSVEKNNIFFNEVTAKINSISISIDKSLLDFKDFTKDIEKSLRDFKGLIVDIDSTLSSRLDRYKSDIQVDFRNECQKLQSKHDDLSHSVNGRFEKFGVFFANIKNFIFFNIFLSVVNILIMVYVFYKFF